MDMDGFAVTRGNDCKKLLSVFSLKDCSVNNEIELPLYKDDSVLCVSSCREMICIHGHKGEIVLYSIELKRLVVLPPPPELLPPNCGYLIVSGIGYDSKSREHKVIRYFSHTDYDESGEGQMSCTLTFEVFSTALCSWKSIIPPFFKLMKGGVYVEETGSCYWIAVSPKDISYVMSFDFATEKFDAFPLPTETHLLASGDGIKYELVEYHGSIGAIFYSSNEPIRLFVWKERLWHPTCVVYIADLERPLGLRGDRFLTLEARPSGGRSQLMVYDLDTKTLKKLNIYDYPRPMSGMGGFAVIHSGGDRKHCLSLIGSEDIYEVDVVELPFGINELIGLVGSFGFLCICGSRGQIILYNIEKNQYEALPPLPEFPPLGCLRFCGFGYDTKSGQHKILSNYSCNHYDERGEMVHKEHFQLFSFRSCSWKSITAPEFFLRKDGIFIEQTGSFYWIVTLMSKDSYEDLGAYLGPSFGDSFKDMVHHVMSFDFATESFGHLRLPTTCNGETWDENTDHKLVHCLGCLGVMVYSSDKLSSLEIFVWKVKQRSWCLIYAVSLPPDVGRPLGLQDDHLLFLETRPISGRSQLMVYDLDTQMSKKLDIYDYPGSMCGISYRESIEKRRRRNRNGADKELPLACID